MKIVFFWGGGSDCSEQIILRSLQWRRPDWEIYKKKICVKLGESMFRCNLEELPRAIDNTDGGFVHIYIYIYIYVCVCVCVCVCWLVGWLGFMACQSF